MFSTSAALLFGLGTRIAIDKFFVNPLDDPNTPEAIGDILLLGVVQGVALYYTLMEFRDFAFIVGFAIAARLLVEFMMFQDVPKCATTLLGVALGVLVTDVLSQLIEDGYVYDLSRWNGLGLGFGFGGAVITTASSDMESEYGGGDRSASSFVVETRRRKRLVKFSSTAPTDDGDQPSLKPARPPKKDPSRKWRTEASVPPSITSSTEGLVDPHGVMDPLEREVATLRARASLADSERRRFKEEKKWAVSQGNLARASQMNWQVQRYTLLTQSFTKEADDRLLQVTAMRAARQQARREAQLPAPQSTERLEAERHTNHPRQTAPSTSQQFLVERDTTVSIETSRHRRRSSSGNLKSAMRSGAR